MFKLNSRTVILNRHHQVFEGIRGQAANEDLTPFRREFQGIADQVVQNFYDSVFVNTDIRKILWGRKKFQGNFFLLRQGGQFQNRFTDNIGHADVDISVFHLVGFHLGIVKNPHDRV